MTGLRFVCMVIAVVVSASNPGAAAVTADSACQPGPIPYDGVAGASLSAEVHSSEGDDPVSYVLWSGTVPSFDGMPLSVDVTVPCGATGPLPTVVMAHGFTDDKTVWEETGKSDSVHSADRPGSNDRWNNIWFASRGYAVLNYTARGWRDSCGPDTPGHSVDDPAPECAPYEFWIHLNDKRWEVRDSQWLAGGLVQTGIADPLRLAITGGSYGGGPTSMGALLADRMVCGADPVPRELGPDPCRLAHDGDLVPWTTPDGRTPLEWVAAIPMYSYADLLHVLAPNGRVTDGWELAPPSGSTVEPFGVPLASTVSGLLSAASVFGSVAPSGRDSDSDLSRSTDRLLAGDPFPASDPEVARGVRIYRDLKSPITIEPQGRVPIFWVQGFTDALFPGTEALLMVDHLRADDPTYPIKVFLGDIGHDYSAERQDDWDLVKDQMNEFLDHYLRPDRTPREPVFDIGATVTRCLDGDAPLEYVSAARWHELHRGHVVLRSDTRGRTSTVDQGPAGIATDPISGATLPGPDSYKGCRVVRPPMVDPTVATYEFPIDDDLTLMGGAVVDLTYSAGAGGIPLAVRLWDVDYEQGEQGLVTRGVFRTDTTHGGDDARAVFQLRPQGYRLEKGHTLRVEVTGNDSPYLQESSVATDVVVDRLSVTLPLFDDTHEDGAGAPAGEDAAVEQSGANRIPWWMLAAAAAVPTALIIGAVARRRPQAHGP